MTVKRLISELRKMPENAEVGFTSHDNYDHEIQGWAETVRLIEKEGISHLDFETEADAEIFKSKPQQWVSILC